MRSLENLKSWLEEEEYKLEEMLGARGSAVTREKQRRGGEEDGSMGSKFILLPPKGILESHVQPDMEVLKPSGSLAVWDEIVDKRFSEQNIILRN